MYFFAIVAGATALYFAGVTIRRLRPAEFLALILWAAYAVYEYFVANGTLCDANCNIRVDLVVLFPLLGIVTYLALQKEERTGAAAILTVICLGLAALAAAAMGYVAVAVATGVAALVFAVVGIKARARAGRV